LRIAERAPPGFEPSTFCGRELNSLPVHGSRLRFDRRLLEKPSRMGWRPASARNMVVKWDDTRDSSPIGDRVSDEMLSGSVYPTATSNSDSLVGAAAFEE
jgi:hypothetical protein